MRLVQSLCDTDEALKHLNYSLNWNKDEFLFALSNVAIAQGGIAKLADATGFGKESLYKSLIPSHNPRFDTILAIVRALGYNFELVHAKDHYRGKQKLIRQNSLAHLHGNIALEWHPTKNDNLSANDVLPGSRKKIWWECSKDKTHTWQASCNARISTALGCPFCNATKQNQ